VPGCDRATATRIPGTATDRAGAGDAACPDRAGRGCGTRAWVPDAGVFHRGIQALRWTTAARVAADARPPRVRLAGREAPANFSYSAGTDRACDVCGAPVS